MKSLLKLLISTLFSLHVLGEGGYLIVGGNSGHPDHLDDRTFYLPGSKNAPSCDLEKPVGSPLAQSVSGFIAGVGALICGGVTKKNARKITDKCWNFDGGNGWSLSRFRLNEKRKQAAGISVKGGSEFWVAGGNDGNADLNSVEVLKSGATKFEAGPDLPLAVHSHCLLNINDEYLFLAGGGMKVAENSSASFLDPRITYSDKTFLFNLTASRWIEVEGRMTDARRGASCFLIENSSSEIEVVMIGGKSIKDFLLVQTSEIFNLKERKWRPGPDFPIRSAFAGTTSAGRIMGGLTYGHEFKLEDAIYEFDSPETGWKKSERKLPGGVRDWFSLIRVPENFVRC